MTNNSPTAPEEFAKMKKDRDAMEAVQSAWGDAEAAEAIAAFLSVHIPGWKVKVAFVRGGWAAFSKCAKEGIYYLDHAPARFKGGGDEALAKRSLNPSRVEDFAPMAKIAASPIGSDPKNPKPIKGWLGLGFGDAVLRIPTGHPGIVLWAREVRRASAVCYRESEPYVCHFADGGEDASVEAYSRKDYAVGLPFSMPYHRSDACPSPFDAAVAAIERMLGDFPTETTAVLDGAGDR